MSNREEEENQNSRTVKRIQQKESTEQLSGKIESEELRSHSHAHALEQKSHSNTNQVGEDSNTAWQILEQVEWEVNTDDLEKMTVSKKENIEYHTTMERLKIETHTEELMLRNRVLKEGYPNRFGARIQVPTKINLKLFEQELEGYHDTEVIEWM